MNRLADSPDADAPVDPGMRPAARVVMQVLWPAFLLAIVAEGIFFSMIDPAELRVVNRYLNGSREAAYTIAFFVFWALFACASGITWFLGRTIGVPPRIDED